MTLSFRLLLCLVFLIFSTCSFCQSNIFKPEIIRQTPSPIVMDVNQSLTLDLNNLVVTDADPQPVYPNGFTLNVNSGKNYNVAGATITPDKDFTGSLKVPVRVNDGKHDSKDFEVRIEVRQSQNVSPVITGQDALKISQGQNLTIELTNLKVTDPDNIYPNDFTLKVFDGNNYSHNGNNITPNSSFTGKLKVPVSVNDGQNESKKYDLTVEVSKGQNEVPQITGQDELKMNEDEVITLQLSNLKVTDPDNTYPKDFTLNISNGSNYTVSGSKIAPAKDFFGTLSVQVTVNDGQNDSPTFDVLITVNPVNDGPVITGQTPLATNKNTPVAILISSLAVTDIDNKFPDDFSLKISNGNNYSVAGNTVNPAPSFTGILFVNVTVSDGNATSNSYRLKIEVRSPANSPPVITGQKPISITENTSVVLRLSDLLVTDSDNTYPNGFALKVFSGNNYSVNGTTVSPLPNFTGMLSVEIRVNDGSNDSAPFTLKIQVVPPSSTPKINGQKELITQEDSTLSIALTDLIVTDADNPGYPKGFSLIVLPGLKDVYTATGNIITPAPNLNGFIEVGVKVSDGVNISDEFKLSILVTPVNDLPEILEFETAALAYEPGKDPINITETLELRDVDNDHLSMAEIGFRSQNYSALNDELLFNNDTSKIRAIYDPAGILFLIGYATVDEYQTALRSVQYNYKMTLDESGNPSEILSGTRTLYLYVHDGQHASETHERQIAMETKISLDIPNAFTPNGDKANDTWHLRATNKDQLDKAIIRVYSKRGLLLYESTGFTKDWDGYYNGQLLPVDTYYYIIDLNLSYMKKTYKGAVAILH